MITIFSAVGPYVGQELIFCESVRVACACKVNYSRWSPKWPLPMK